LASTPLPGFESFKTTYEFDLSKFIISTGSDVYNADGNKANATVKWTYTPKTDAHVFNLTKKAET